MNLDILDNLIKNLKDNELIKKFGEELNDYLDQKLDKTNNQQESILEKIQNENKISTEYRDKMLITRSTILQEYAQKTADKGTMYYIYDQRGDNYLLPICEKQKSNQLIKMSKQELPEEAKIDSVLRIKNGKYELDKEATEIIKDKMNKKEYLKKRIEKIIISLYSLFCKSNEVIYFYISQATFYLL